MYVPCFNPVNKNIKKINAVSRFTAPLGIIRVVLTELKYPRRTA
jgi:hypothetical protein